MSLFAQICVTLAVVSVTTAIAIRLGLQAPDPDNEYGHQGGNLALAIGSIMAALLYTPVLAHFVWGASWWLSLLVTPSAFATGILGLILALPLLNVLEWLMPTLESE